MVIKACIVALLFGALFLAASARADDLGTILVDGLIVDIKDAGLVTANLKPSFAQLLRPPTRSSLPLFFMQRTILTAFGTLGVSLMMCPWI